jgi:hypothetical protein
MESDTDMGRLAEVDLHRLELRFAGLRLPEPRAVERLAHSIERAGQLVPCVVVAAGAALVLLDGYRRVAALRRLARDRARVERWDCGLGEALLGWMARSQGRALVPIEEALLLRELVQGRGLSQHEVASRCGRDVSWVNRRLQLVSGLPDALFGAVRQGTLSTWAATRVMAPLARANSQHAQQLLVGLQREGLSTRELRQWFEHYQRSPRVVRERLVQSPRLFIEAAHAADEQRADAQLCAGPEGHCARALRQCLALIERLRPQLSALAAAGGLNPILVNQLARLRAVIEALHSEVRSEPDHDPQPDPRCGAHPACPEPQSARDQPPAVPVT